MGRPKNPPPLRLKGPPDPLNRALGVRTQLAKLHAKSQEVISELIAEIRRMRKRDDQFTALSSALVVQRARSNALERAIRETCEANQALTIFVRAQQLERIHAPTDDPIGG